MKKLLLLLVLAAGAAPAVAAPADEDAELRRVAQGLNSVLSDANQQEAKIEELLRDPARAKRLLAVALKMNEEKDSKLAYGANFILANVALELRELDNGAKLFEKAIKQGDLLHSDQKVTMASLGLIDLKIAAKKYDEAEKLCQKLLEREAEDGSEKWARIGQAFGLQRLVRVTAYRGKPDQALKKLEDFNQASEFIKETKAWVLTYANKYDEAIAIYQELLDGVMNKESQTDMRDRYARALASLHGDQGNLDKATAVLQPLLKKNPDDPGLNNDLGYIWAEFGHKLDDAEKMIQKALNGDPNNASYHDSLAWVYFKQKKVDLAKKHMLKAVSLPHGRNPEILEHLGDILAAAGDRKEAEAAWRQAIEMTSGSARDLKRKSEMEKKLKEADSK